MNPSYMHYEGPSVIPASAIKVNVTHILNPYMITIMEFKDYTKKLIGVNMRLHKALRHKDHILQDPTIPAKVGDTVIGSNLQGPDGDILCYLFRGIIEYFDCSSHKYTVFLTDYGIVAELDRNQFTIVPSNTVPQEYLTSTISLYNIVPSIVSKDLCSEFHCNSLISGKWSKVVLQFLMELIAASSAIYFDCLAVDESKQKYGDLYLDIDNKIVSLRRSLVFNRYAEYLEDLQDLIDHPGEKNYVKLKDNQLIFLSHSEAVHLNKESTNIFNSSNRKCNVPDIELKSKQHGVLMKSKSYNNTENILTYGIHTYAPVKDVVHAKFPAGVHASWDSIVRSSRPKRIQSYIWPAIKKFSNVLAIGVADSGKTFGHAVAVSALLATHKTLPRGSKVSALILCSSTSQTLSVQSLYAQFLQNYDVKTVAAFHGKTDRSVAAEAYSGCQVLVTTPRYLTRFMGRNKHTLNFKFLRYLILDQADVILNKYTDAIDELFAKYKIILNREMRGNDMPVLQTIMVARRCTLSLKKLTFALMEEPYICIGSFIEACVFRSVRLSLLVTNSHNKQQKVLDILSGRPEIHLKSMIICTNAEEATNLYTFLSLPNTYLAHENMIILDLKSAVENFKETVSRNPIFICTDEVLSELHITDVDYLIHYSVLMDLQTQFNFRFSTLLKHLQMEKKPWCRVFVFVDENNDVQFESIVRTVERMKVPIPPQVLNHVKKISITLDRNKKNFAICDNVKSLGFCPDQSSCMFRHCILPDIDKPMTQIKAGDKVKVMILYIHNATHFSARITEYISTNGNESNNIKLSSDDYLDLPLKIQKFYSNKSNRRKCPTVNVGDICVLEDCIENFQRVQILYFEQETSNYLDNSKSVCVRCIDNGIILDRVGVNRLLSIPDELLNLNSHIVEIFLTGIAPYDDECQWSNFANDVVHEWFTENFHNGCYVFGDVLLHFGNTIWVESLKIGTEIIGYPDLIGACLKSELIKKNHAVPNEKHMDRLHDLCAATGFEQMSASNV